MAKRYTLQAAVAVALLVGGPARAQEWQRAGNPEPVQAEPARPAAKPKPARAAKLAAPVKTASAPAPAAVPLPAAKPEPARAEPKKPEPADAASKRKKPDPRDVTGTIPPTERTRIRAALAWAGDFASTPDGEDAFTAAIKNFQKRNNVKVTGELTHEQRAQLIAAAQSHENNVGWNVVADPATGIRLGLPAKLMPRVQDAPHGTRWSSAHGEAQIETFRIKEPSVKLAALFEREKKQPADRKIESSALHDDGFVISGTQGLKYFSVRAQMRDGEIRGMTLSYDQAWEGIIGSVAGAVGSAFAPFPDGDAPYAALTKSVDYGTGLVVSRAGYIVAPRRLVEGCQVIDVPGLANAERIAADGKSDLSLLRVYGRHKLTPVLLTGEAPKPGDVTLLGIPDPREQNGASKPAEIKARLASDDSIEIRPPVPVAGLAGAAVLDSQHRMLGIMAMRVAVLASAEPARSPVRLVSAEAIRTFLAAHDVPLADSREGDIRASVVRVICMRK